MRSAEVTEYYEKNVLDVIFFVLLKVLARKYTLPKLMSAIKICCKHGYFHVFDKVFIIRKVKTKVKRFALFFGDKAVFQELQNNHFF